MDIFGPHPSSPVTRQRLKDIASLARRKGRRRLGEFLVEGVRSVEAALAAGAPLAEVLVADVAHPGPGDRVAGLAEAAGVPVHRVAPHELDRASDAQTSQGVLAVARSVVAAGLADASGPVLLLDGVQDPGNVGALVRTAAWYGVAAVVGDENTADFESPKAVRASMGGVWDLGLVRVPDLVPVLDQLAAAGVQAWGADLGGTPVEAWAPGPDAALVMGSEAHGLSPGVSDWLRRQPPAGGRFVHVPPRWRRPPAAGAAAGGAAVARGVESLNVVVAGGVLLSRWLG